MASADAELPRPSNPRAVVSTFALATTTLAAPHAMGHLPASVTWHLQPNGEESGGL